jgi:hypothetical protein
MTKLMERQGASVVYIGPLPATDNRGMEQLKALLKEKSK